MLYAVQCFCGEQMCIGVVRVLRRHIIYGACAVSFRTPVHVYADVLGHLYGKGFQGVAGIQAFAVGPEAQESVLCHILGILAVAEEVKAHTQHLFAQTGCQFFKFLNAHTNQYTAFGV